MSDNKTATDIPNDLAQLLDRIGEPQSAPAVADGWTESMRLMPGELPVLDPQAISSAREYCGLDASVQEGLLGCARRIAADEDLRKLAWHAVRRLYESDGATDFGAWPTLAGVLGEGDPIAAAGFTAGSGCFALIVGLAMVPYVIAAHDRLGVADDVTRATCRQIACFAGNYRGGSQGRLGLFAKQLYWLRHYTTGRLFRLGRFEYMLKTLDVGLHLFRDRQTGRHVALAPQGWVYDDHGYALATGQSAGTPTRSPEGGWTASLTLTPDCARGYPVDPAGRVCTQQIELGLDRWQLIVKPGDTVLDLHIPAGDRMPLDACGESMRHAVGFFARHFPDRPATAFWCWSWIFGPMLEEILPAGSNLVRFLHQCYLAPVPSNGGSLWFIYLRDIDRTSPPRENALQAAVADFLAGGGTWRDACMVYPADMMTQFGTEPFRKGWEAPDTGCTPVASGLS